jgi:hydrogenase/urease accessory protein HupE
MSSRGACRISAFAFSLAIGAASPATGHELRPAYLELKEAAPRTYDVLFKVPARGDDQRLSLHLRLPDDFRFVVPAHARIANGSYLERSRIEVDRPAGIGGVEIGIEGLAGTLTDALVRIEHASGASQVVRLTPDRPEFVVAAAPRASEVALTYLVLGIEHILLGIDHLLFVAALLILVRGTRRLVATITAFTVAHSITLSAATLGFASIPGPPVEAVIALSIVFVACEILHRRQGRIGVTERRPWIVAFVFGLLHGFGFAGALGDVGMPDHAIPLALACFNAGVEVGQLAFVAAGLLLAFVLRNAIARDTLFAKARFGETLGAYAIGGIAAYWTVERTLGFLTAR